MAGWIKESRAVLEQFRYKPNVKLVYQCLVFNAVYEPTKQNGIELQRGELFITLSQIMKETGLTKDKVRYALEVLKSTTIITTISPTIYPTIITTKTPLLKVCDYECYGISENDSPTITDTIIDTTSTTIITTLNKEIEELKKIINNISPLYPPLKSGEGNEKNLEPENLKNQISLKTEKEKEKKYTAPAKKEKEKFVKPTIEQIAEYCKERNNNVDANIFFDFYESKGWVVGKNPMKDWKASVRTWEKNRNQNNYYNGNNTTDYTDFRKYVSPTTDYGQSTI